MCKQKSSKGAALTHATRCTLHPLFAVTCLLKTCSRRKVSAAWFCKWGLFIFPLQYSLAKEAPSQNSHQTFHFHKGESTVSKSN